MPMADCPKMDCHKDGVCPLGLAKNKDGCDVCECHGCPCTNDCFSMYCPDYSMDEKTGCDLCSCAVIDCEVSSRNNSFLLLILCYS